MGNSTFMGRGLLSKRGFGRRRSMTKQAFQWKILVFILFITIVNYVDRSAIAYAILPIQNAFGIDTQDFGFIASAFGIGYFCASFFAGLLVDRFGSIKVWSIFAAIWSVAIMLMGAAQGFWSLCFLRLILGIAETVHFPAFLKTVADWLPPRWRARCVGFGLLGVPLASVVGSPILSYAIHAFDWRVMFFAIGIPGLIWALLWPLCFKNKKAPPKPAQKEIEKPWKTGLSRFFFGAIVSTFLSSVTSSFLRSPGFPATWKRSTPFRFLKQVAL
jgi:MFS family permease